MGTWKISAALASAVVAVAALTALTACSGPGQATEPTGPAGVIALGHSGLTGENADPERQGSEAREQSWATGDSPDVNSIYLRMVAVDPVNEGHVFNAAAAGAASATLANQAEAALEEVPTPALVIIQTIDGDIRCDGTDAENVEAFGENVRSALDVIAEGSPESRILFVSQRGRPEMIAQYLDAAATEPVPGEESCEFVNAAGEYVPANAAYLTAVIESYETEQAEICAEYPHCADDDGANTTFADTPEDLEGGDGNHLTTAGQARTAELMWPEVEKLMGY